MATSEAILPVLHLLQRVFHDFDANSDSGSVAGQAHRLRGYRDDLSII